MHLLTIHRSKFALLAIGATLALSAHLIAEDLLKENFKDIGNAEITWTLSPDTGEVLISKDEAGLSGAGFPSIRTNDTSNFNDDGTKRITYEIDFSIESGQLIFWIRLDEESLPAGSVLLAGGSKRMQSYSILLSPDTGQGLVALNRNNHGQPGVVLWNNDPGLGVGVSLNDGILKVELENEADAVTINLSINERQIASYIDDAPERIDCGVGVGVSAYSDTENASLQIHSISVSGVP